LFHGSDGPPIGSFADDQHRNGGKASQWKYKPAGFDDIENFHF